MTGKNDTANSKRIAKNTIVLYFRMIVVTLLSLVTVRYTLKLLGQEDYGIYNVVAGVVTFMSFVTAPISAATQRFLAYKLGEHDGKGYNDMFNMLLLAFVAVGVLICVGLEVLSYPIIYYWLQIPLERQEAAFIVYHLAVISFFSIVAAMPFLSSILANERMGVYAYVTIVDTIVKLALLALLIIDSGDKLIVYATGMTAVSVLINVIYIIYNQRFIPNTRLYYHWDGDTMRRVLSYTGWSFFGAVSGIMCIQGLTILMNLFFGVTVNAAKAISDKVQAVVRSLVINFYMAVSPQITKSYAASDMEYAIKLAYTSTRLAYYLMLLVITPVIVLADKLLSLWLGSTCSDDMVLFSQLSLVYVLVNVFETPITFLMSATGDIRRYQIYVGCITLLVVPISGICFALGCGAYMGFLILIFVYGFAQLVRVYVLKEHYDVSMVEYFSKVLKKPMLISLVDVICLFALFSCGTNDYIVAIVMIVVLLCVIWLYGLEKAEKEYICTKIKGLIHKPY